MKSVSRRPFLLALFLVVSAMPTVGISQDDTDGNGENVSRTANGTDTAQDDAPLREQTIYVPYDKLRNSFEKQGRGVFLPYEQFQKLWKAARAAEQRVPETKPPVAALITEIESVATVEKDVMRVEATAQIELLTEGWHKVPLRLSDAAIGAATFDDRPARILSDPHAGYQLLVKKEGDQPERRILKLQYSKAYSKSPGRNSVAVQAPQAPVNRWQVRIPQSGVKVNVHPMIAAAEQPGEGEEAETVMLAFVGAAPTVRIDWTAESEGATGLDALATVQAQQQITVDEGVVRTRTQLTYEITRADLEQLRIAVPADHKVAGVFDPNVRSWEVAAKDGQQVISVQLFEPARGRQQLVIELEKFSGDVTAEELEVPVVQALNVVRQQGIVVVRLAEGLRGQTTTRSGLLQIDAGELTADLARQQWAFSYRYASLPFELKLKVEKLQPRISADQLVEVYLEPQQLSIDLLVNYRIEKAGVFQLELQIPSGFEVRKVQGRATPSAAAVAVDTHDLTGEDKTRLQVNLSRKALGNVGLHVQLVRRLEDANLLSPTGEASEIALSVPRVAPEGVARATGRMIVWKPDSLRVNPAALDGLQSISFQEAYRQLPSTRDGRFTDARPALAFAYTDQAAALKLNVERRKPHITVRQLLVAEIESGQVKYSATFRYSIRYSGAESLRIDVPTELADKIRNDTPSIRDAVLQPQPEDVAEGYTAWSLSGESELLGDVTVKLAWEEKIDALDIGKSVPLRVPALQPRNADRAWGQIVIAKSETIDVLPAKGYDGLRPIDPTQDISAQDRVRGAALSMEFHDDWNLTLEATRYRLEEVKRTSIELAVVRQVVTRSGQTSVQALYRMRSARQRLTLKLPAAVDPQTAFDAQPMRIDGMPVPLERGDGDEFFIPLVGRDPEQAFLLEMRYTLAGSAADLELPEFPDEPAVQKVYLCAYLPDDLALLGARGPWASHQPGLFDQRNQHGGYGSTDAPLIKQVCRETKVTGDPAEGFQTDGILHVFSTLRPASGSAGALHLRTMSSFWFQVILFIGILFMGLAMLRHSVARKFTALALLVIALILGGVFLPTLSRQILAGILPWALAIVVILWMVWMVLRDLPRLAAARAMAAETQAGAAATLGATPPASPPAVDTGQQDVTESPPADSSEDQSDERGQPADKGGSSEAEEQADEGADEEGGRNDG